MSGHKSPTGLSWPRRRLVAAASIAASAGLSVYFLWRLRGRLRRRGESRGSGRYRSREGSGPDSGVRGPNARRRASSGLSSPSSSVQSSRTPSPSARSRSLQVSALPPAAIPRRQLESGRQVSVRAFPGPADRLHPQFQSQSPQPQFQFHAPIQSLRSDRRLLVAFALALLSLVLTALAPHLGVGWALFGLCFGYIISRFEARAHRPLILNVPITLPELPRYPTPSSTTTTKLLEPSPWPSSPSSPYPPSPKESARRRRRGRSLQRRRGRGRGNERVRDRWTDGEGDGDSSESQGEGAALAVGPAGLRHSRRDSQGFGDDAEGGSVAASHFPSIRYPVDVELNGSSITINDNEAYTINSDIFVGKALLKIPTGEHPSPNSAFFEKNPRLQFSIDVQGQFTRRPQGSLWIGVELAGPLQVSWMQKQFLKTILAAGNSMSSSPLHHSFEGGLDEEGSVPHVMVPFQVGADRLVVTPPGEEPPPLCVDGFPAEQDCRGAPLELSAGTTYSINFKSSTLDFLNWSAVNLKLPGCSGGLDLGAFVGTTPIRVACYHYKGDAGGDHLFADREYLFAFTFTPVGGQLEVSADADMD